MRVVFMGTPDFAVPSLEITAKEHELLAVVTQPDRKRDRGQNVKFSPIKDRALAYDVPIYQPEKVSTSEFIALMEQLNPDVIVVVAFGQKIPKALLELPAHGCINVHASLLPQYRGAAPIQYAIINGDQK
ncbi:MAG: methionyl-tRNA formyltransferase, partial [Firmicutes bacterium]|nr:methionyl-tRNA formyltransferase [Bacillota bacterium]